MELREFLKRHKWALVITNSFKDEYVYQKTTDGITSTLRVNDKNGQGYLYIRVNDKCDSELSLEKYYEAYKRSKKELEATYLNLINE